MSKLTSTERRVQLLDVAIELAKTKGYQQLTRELIAAKAGVSPATVTAYFSTTVQLKRAVIRAAVERKVLPIIAQGLACRDPQARKAPPDLKERAAADMLAG